MRIFVKDTLTHSWRYAAELHLPPTSLDALAAGHYPQLVRAGAGERQAADRACARVVGSR
jgi:hypothetical protein